MRAVLLSVAACSVGCLAPVAVDQLDASASSTGDDDPTGEAPQTSGTTGNGDDATSAASTTSGDGSTSSNGESTGVAPDGSTSDAGEGSSSTGSVPLEGCDAHPDALLCDDFESDIDETLWQVRTAEGGAVDVADGVLRVDLQSAAGAHGFLRTHEIFPLPDNRFFGRVMFRIAPESPSFHAYLFAAVGSLDGSPARYRLDSNNGGSLNSRYTHASIEQHGGLRKHGHEAVAETWTCIEWEYDGSTNSMRYWFDGVLNEDMLVDGEVEDPPWTAPEFEYFEIGFHTHQAPDNVDALEILYDDLVLHTEKVGCPTDYKG